MLKKIIVVVLAFAILLGGTAGIVATKHNRTADVVPPSGDIIVKLADVVPPSGDRAV